MRLQQLSHNIGVSLCKVLPHDDNRGCKLTLWPKGAFIGDESRPGILDDTRHPRLWQPCGIQLAPTNQVKDIRRSILDDVDTAALVLA